LSYVLIVITATANGITIERVPGFDSYRDCSIHAVSMVATTTTPDRGISWSCEEIKQ
jgi:hypothetical protein